MIADLWDLTFKAAGAKKAVSYPRPFGAKEDSKRRGDAAGRSPEEVKALLRNSEYYGQPEAPV